MEQPLVSIIIPVYNADRYIAKAIQSALDQTWPNKEIIVVDDGSTDNSLLAAKQFVNCGINIITQQNKGASAARNLGIRNAKGEYIQFLDADDLLSANKISEQMKVLLGLPEHLALCPTVHFPNGTDYMLLDISHDWGSKGTDTPVEFLLDLYGAYGQGGMIQPNAWLTPRILIDKAGLWNEMKSPDDDGEFFCRVVLASKGIRYADKAVNYYRKFSGEASLSMLQRRESVEGVLLAIAEKHKSLKAASNSPLVDLVIGKQYWDIGVKAYPAYRALSKQSLNKAKELGYKGSVYQGGPFGKILSKLIGWKAVKTLAHFRFYVYRLMLKPK